MREFYTTAEATENGFLFISYSSDDKDTVKAWADYLIDKGVRVWWDRAFKGGDDWETTAKTLLSHENCCGILFFASKSAIASKNVAKEWRTAAKTKEGRSENGFYAQIIMVEDAPALDYKYLTNYVKKTEELFSDDDYDDFRSLFGKKDHLYYCASRESDMEALHANIKNRASDAVNEEERNMDRWDDLAGKGNEVTVKLGTYGANHKPLVWQQIRQENTQVTMMCREILSQTLGGQPLKDWFRDFLRQNFSQEEQEVLQGKLRLLTLDEAAEVPQALLAADQIWWLADCDGHLQSVVREDGTVYQSGYNNKRYEKGIRPVFKMDISELFPLMDNK